MLGKDIFSLSWSLGATKKAWLVTEISLGASPFTTTPPIHPLPLAMLNQNCLSSAFLSLSASLFLSSCLSSFILEVTEERNKRRCQLTEPLQSDNFRRRCLAAAKIRFCLRKGRRGDGREQQVGARQRGLVMHRQGSMLSRGSGPWTSRAF